MQEQLTLDDFSLVLKSKDILDVKSPNWQKLSIDHGEQALKDYNFKKPQELRLLFKEQRNVCAIYAYFQGDKCLYIGKSGNLQERIYQHFLESCKRWGHDRYQKFFSKYCGTIDLYILPLGIKDREGEFLRTIVEKILEVHYKPEMGSVKL